MTRYSSEPRKKILPDQSRINEIEYFQSIYPQNIKILQKYVIEECDRMDYKGSPIYDEYPDMQMIRQACGKICKNIPEPKGNWENAGEMDLEQVEIYEIGGNQGETTISQHLKRKPGPGHPPGPPPGSWGPPPGPPPGPWGPPGPPPGPGRPPGPGHPSGPWGPPPGPGHPPGPWGPPPGPPPGPWGPPPGLGRPPGHQKPGSSAGGWLQDIVQVLLTNEIQNRRCRSGRC